MLLCHNVLPPPLHPRSHLFGPAGLLLALMERCVLCAILTGQFFICVEEREGGVLFKWSTWRLWPVINEFAVSHGSCKETSGSKCKVKKKRKRKRGWGGRCSDLQKGSRLSMQGGNKWWHSSFHNSYSVVKKMLHVLIAGAHKCQRGCRNWKVTQREIFLLHCQD